jgi:hypothetical protein
MSVKDGSLLTGIALGVIVVTLVSVSFLNTASATTNYSHKVQIEGTSIVGITLWHLEETLNWASSGGSVVSADITGPSAWVTPLWSYSNLHVDYLNVYATYAVGQSAADFVHYILIPIPPFIWTIERVHAWVQLKGYPDGSFVGSGGT